MNTHCGRTLLDHCSHWAILPLPGDMAAGRNSLFQEKIEESAKLGRHRSKIMPASGHFLSFPGERHSPTKPLLGGKLSGPPGHHKQRMHAGLPSTGKSAPEGGTHAQCQANRDNRKARWDQGSIWKDSLLPWLLCRAAPHLRIKNLTHRPTDSSRSLLGQKKLPLCQGSWVTSPSVPHCLTPKKRCACCLALQLGKSF